MIFQNQKVAFGSHIARLERSPFPRQKQRVADYLRRYLQGEAAFRRHPVLAFRHWFLQKSTLPTPRDAVFARETLSTVQEDAARHLARIDSVHSQYRLTRVALYLSYLTAGGVLVGGALAQDIPLALSSGVGIAACAAVQYGASSYFRNEQEEHQRAYEQSLLSDLDHVRRGLREVISGIVALTEKTAASATMLKYLPKRGRGPPS